MFGGHKKSKTILKITNILDLYTICGNAETRKFTAKEFLSRIPRFLYVSLYDNHAC
jgi:hypothetical protein